MKSDSRTKVVSEWEENFVFDHDDPDFVGPSNEETTDVPTPLPLPVGPVTSKLLFAAEHAHHHHHHQQHHHRMLLRVPNNTSAPMSMASVQAPHLADLCSPIGSNISMSSSFSDLVGSPSLDLSSDTVLTIEDLRAQMGQCFTCGVSWVDDHVSLDCSECGGYSMERPCPMCDGACGQVWKRDFNLSHALSRARWSGMCPKCPAPPSLFVPNPTTVITSVQTCGASQQQFLAQELCARLEKLSASAQT